MSALGTLEFIRDYLFPPSIDVRPVRPGLSRLDRVSTRESTQFVSENGTGRRETGAVARPIDLAIDFPRAAGEGKGGLFAGS